LFKGFIYVGLNLFFIVRVRVIKIIIDKNRARTPPSLLGIERRIAYANKKYHSGWICGGVISEFAEIKFSGSVNR
jgi:hypothetical protein